MSDLTRDELAEVLRSAREESTALGDVRIGLSEVNGNIVNLTTRLDLSLSAVTAQQEAQAKELATLRVDQRREREAIHDRLTTVEKWQWRVAGAIGLIGVLMGLLGAGAWPIL